MGKALADGFVGCPISVYAYLDAAGRYLYIGQTRCLRTRHIAHRQTGRSWFPQAVERVILLETLWRHSARKAEARAILEHRPLHNKIVNRELAA